MGRPRWVLCWCAVGLYHLRPSERLSIRYPQGIITLLVVVTLAQQIRGGPHPSVLRLIWQWVGLKSGFTRVVDWREQGFVQGGCWVVFLFFRWRGRAKKFLIEWGIVDSGNILGFFVHQGFEAYLVGHFFKFVQ